MKKFLFALPLAIGLCLSACSESSSTASEESEGGSGGSSVNGGKLVAGASTMVDPRDEQVYTVKKIGDLTWFVEPLRFVDSVTYSSMAGYTECDVDSASGKVLGCGYSWKAALEGREYPDDTLELGICPPGWHVPNMSEFNELKSALKESCDTAGKCLKEKQGWEPGAFWTSTPSRGVSLTTPTGGTRIESNDYNAVSFVLYAEKPAGGSDYLYPVFAGRSSLLYLHCVQGSVDSVAEFETYQKSKESVLKARAAAEAAEAAKQKKLKDGAKAYFNPDLHYKNFVDARDGNEYGTIVIGQHRWMAENLRYNPPAREDENVSVWVYTSDRTFEDSLRAVVIGRAYSLDQISPDSGAANPCPSGWHIPSITEWNDLMKETEAPGDLLATNGLWERAGATNRLGFSAIGTRYDEVSVFNETWFWTKEETKFGYSWFSNNFQEDDTEYAAYIRCIED